MREDNAQKTDEQTRESKSTQKLKLMRKTDKYNMVQ